MPGLNVSMHGAIVTGDADGTMSRALDKIIRALIEKGHERLAETLRPRPAGVYLSVEEARKGQASTGNYRRNVHEEIRGHFGALNDSGVVYGPWLEHGGRGFAGYSSFRRTGDWLQTEANGTARKVVDMIVAELD